MLKSNSVTYISVYPSNYEWNDPHTAVARTNMKTDTTKSLTLALRRALWVLGLRCSHHMVRVDIMSRSKKNPRLRNQSTRPRSRIGPNSVHTIQQGLYKYGYEQCGLDRRTHDMLCSGCRCSPVWQALYRPFCWWSKYHDIHLDEIRYPPSMLLQPSQTAIITSLRDSFSHQRHTACYAPLS